MRLSLRIKLMGKLKRHGKEKHEFLFTGQSIVSNIGVYTTLSPKGFVAMEKENMLKVAICNQLFSSSTKTM